jgi:hypothetical protein
MMATNIFKESVTQWPKSSISGSELELGWPGGGKTKREYCSKPVGMPVGSGDRNEIYGNIE